jgi:hypothetical protein
MTFKNTSQTGSFVLRFLFITTFTFIIFIHLFLPIQAIKDGLPVNGSNLWAKGILPYGFMWNNKPALNHEMAGLPRQTKFILPITEQYDYPREVKKIITYDFTNHPPLFLILNKNAYRQLDPNNLCTRVILKSLEKYQLVFENKEIREYKRI